MKFDCEKCGKMDEALLNGYDFGERTLEEVWFRVKKHDNGTCEVYPEDPKELHGLDQKYWLAQAKDFAEKNDVFTCPSCKGQVVPDDML